jgi:hypothetical protein
MKLENFINLSLLHPINIAIIILIATMVPTALRLLSNPPQHNPLTE